MNLNELRDRAYKTACKHGWHEEDLSNEHLLCLVISELMEAVEADRKRMHAFRTPLKILYVVSRETRSTLTRSLLTNTSKIPWRTNFPMP